MSIVVFLSGTGRMKEMHPVRLQDAKSLGWFLLM
jgi:hypothetical protein